MGFVDFRTKIQEQFNSMAENSARLFVVDVDKDEMWNLYLDSFPAGTNNIYRERREHDCSCCRQFIKQVGNVVAINNGEVSSIWDIDTSDATYQTVAKAMSEYIKSKPVVNVFFCKESRVGTMHNFELLPTGESKRWEHFYAEIPAIALEKRRSVGDVQGEFRSTKDVFKRSLEEITEESVTTVLELISQRSLYRGEEWKNPLNIFLEYKRAYSALPDTQKDLYAWEKSVKAGGAIGRIRNHSIGTLLVNISEGMELDLAVRKYEQIVAPANYKRPKAIFTKKMLEEAQKTIEKLGYISALGRRFATLDDITANNILFSNKDSARRITGASIFDEMKKDIPVNPKKFSRIEEIAISDFVSDVLPNAQEVELFLESRHSGNLMSLISPKDKTSKSMFKWNNGFSWAYAGNIADSTMKENVKAAGGKIDGVLRFSIQWNDEDYNPNDFDAHCTQPNGNHIYFGSKHDARTSGELDVDIINPTRNKAAVENITWLSKGRMPKGTYQFFVNCYSNRGGRSGFKAEIEFDGQIFSFDYNRELRTGENVYVADVEFDGENFRLIEKLPSGVSTRDLWGLKTNQFVPVSVICYSPNYWDEQTGVGNRHYFFMLKDCVNPERPNGMFNEYLKEELLKHKRVFEALGSKMAVEDSADQLSGVGFSSTRRNDVVVRVKGATERVLKIKF